MRNRIDEHDRVTTDLQREIRSAPDGTLIMQALARLVRLSAPSRYDLVPDDAALMDELLRRGQLR